MDKGTKKKYTYKVYKNKEDTDMVNNSKGIIKGNAGFSLVELVVVIAILGIISVLAIGQFGNQTATARAQADLVTAQELAKQINLAIAEEKIIPSSADVVTAASNGVLSDAGVIGDVLLGDAVFPTGSGKAEKTYMNVIPILKRGPYDTNDSDDFYFRCDIDENGNVTIYGSNNAVLYPKPASLAAPYDILN